MPVFYLATIMKNITLDGWVVIGLLGILSAASWFVFLSKAFFIYLIEKEDKEFQSAFGRQKTLTLLVEEKEKYQNSTLFKIYEQGCQKLKGCLNNEADCVYQNPENRGLAGSRRSETLNKRAINAIKTVLEKGFIEQSKRLNAWLVLLTLAISGGPLSRVVGDGMGRDEHICRHGRSRRGQHYGHCTGYCLCPVYHRYRFGRRHTGAF